MHGGKLICISSSDLFFVGLKADIEAQCCGLSMINCEDIVYVHENESRCLLCGGSKNKNSELYLECIPQKNTVNSRLSVTKVHC